MKILRLSVTLLFLGLAHASGIVRAADLADYKAQYEAKLARLVNDYEKAASAGLATYDSSLKDLLVSVKKSGDLDKTLLLVAEVKRFSDEGKLAEARPELPALARIHDASADIISKFKLTRARKLLALAAHYDRSLDKFQKSLVRAGKLTEAEDIKKERTRVETSDEVKNANRLIVKVQEDATALAQAKKQGSKLIISAEADAFVRAGKPDLNYGPTRILKNKDSKDGTTRRSYLRFNLTPAKTVFVKSAVIRLKCISAVEKGNPGELFMVKDDGWVESELTWNNRPELTGSLAKWPRPKPGDRVEIDVTKIVLDQLRRDAKLSVSLYVDGAASVVFGSRESDDKDARPVLVIETN